MSVMCGLNVRMMVNNLALFPSLTFRDSMCVLELFIAEEKHWSQESRLSTVTLFIVSLLCVLQNKYDT